MSIGVRSVIVWLLYFFAVELPAHYKLGRWTTGGILLVTVAVVIWLWPVLTFSGTTWGGEKWWPPVTIMVSALAAVLIGHLEYHWSVRYLIAIGIVCAMAMGTHALEKVVAR